MAKAKKLKVLMVDSEHNFYWQEILRHEGYEIELMQPGVFSKKPYAVEELVCTALEALTRQVAADVVIIGNNMGAGVGKAGHVAGDMRPRTIVVWNDPPDGEATKPYRALGFTRFCTRMKLADAIRKMFDTN